MPTQKRNGTIDLAKYRNQKVVKSNELIQKRSHMLSTQEQKIILFLISQIKPEQSDFENQTFDIIDFCEVCGIDSNNGKNYADLRATLKGLRDKSMWVIGEDNRQTLIGWLQKVVIYPNSGKVEVRFDEDMKPFLLDLKERYTQFELIYTLPMKSKYSIRLYEILKSYTATNQDICFTIKRFRELLGAEYEEWYDIRRRVIDPAVKEINTYSDLTISYTTQKKGKGIIGISFIVDIKKQFQQKLETQRAIFDKLSK